MKKIIFKFNYYNYVNGRENDSFLRHSILLKYVYIL